MFCDIASIAANGSGSAAHAAGTLVAVAIKGDPAEISRKARRLLSGSSESVTAKSLELEEEATSEFRGITQPVVKAEIVLSIRKHRTSAIMLEVKVVRNLRKQDSHK